MPRSETVVTHLGGCGVVERELQVKIVVLYICILEVSGDGGRRESRRPGDVCRIFEGHRGGRYAGGKADWVGVRGICRKLKQRIRDRLFRLNRTATPQDEVTSTHRVDDEADAWLHMPFLQIERPIGAPYGDQWRRLHHRPDGY